MRNEQVIDHIVNWLRDYANKSAMHGFVVGVSGVPQGSPPQLGPWIGWRMVHQFMAKNENYTVEMLIQEKDKQKILAAYVPKRKS
ncbi:MAG: hypothetical protein ACKOZY_10280 [Flavobacteriales bacterium]